MSNLSSIQDVQEHLFALKEAELVFDEQITQIREIFTAGKFISKSLSDAVTANLHALISEQEQLTQQYHSLEIGDIPPTISEIESVLEERKNWLRRGCSTAKGWNFLIISIQKILRYRRVWLMRKKKPKNWRQKG